MKMNTLRWSLIALAYISWACLAAAGVGSHGPVNGGGGGSGANTALSNLTTTSVNVGLTIQNGLSLFPTISMANKATGNSDDMYVVAGSATLGAAGSLYLDAGAAGSTNGSAGGSVGIYASDGGAGDANGGSVTLQAGASTGNGGSGGISIASGAASGTATTGTVSMTSGSSTSANANTGQVLIASGPAAAGKNSGPVYLGSGLVDGGTAGSVHLYVNAGNGGTNELKLSGNNMHIETASAAPAVTSCGNTPSIVGNDNVGIATVGSGGVAASCTITFASTWTNAPSCVVIDDTTALLIKATASTTVLTVTQGVAFGAGDKLSYHCLGYL